MYSLGYLTKLYSIITQLNDRTSIEAKFREYYLQNNFK